MSRMPRTAAEFKGSFAVSPDTAKRVRKLKVDLPELTNSDVYLAGVEALETRAATGEFTPTECDHNSPRQVFTGEKQDRRERAAEALKFRRGRAHDNGCPHINEIAAEVTRRIMDTIKLPELRQAG